MHQLTVRPENPEDADELSAIRAVNTAAFGSTEEADLVDKLRAERQTLVSLVAERQREVVGHILFSRMWIESPTSRVAAVALAPMAVLPGHQRQGVGGLLISHGLDWLHGRGEKIVIVVGHPEYYPRFGFSREKARVLESPFPAEAFMALELSHGALEGVRGRVVYPPAFGL